MDFVQHWHLYYNAFFITFFKDVSKDDVEEMLTADDETADALAEFDFVMGEDSGSETDVTVIEVEDGDVDIHMPEEPTTQGTTLENFENNCCGSNFSLV